MLVKDNKKHSLRFVSCPGDPMKKIMHGELQVDGTIELVVDRIENTDETIQSFAESTMIENIMARIAAGQTDLLNQRNGFFMDTVGLPQNMAEVLNLVIKGQEVFEKLPVEIKERFDNDFNKWFVAMDKEDFFEKSGFVSPAGENAGKDPEEGKEVKKE